MWLTPIEVQRLSVHRELQDAPRVAYTVKELRYTLQGEGANVGTPAVLLRFAGCNLWNGHDRHRERAICRFCDTDFVGTDGPGGGRYPHAAKLADAVRNLVPVRAGGTLVVCTGGEPLLQLDSALISALRESGLRVAVETNGTLTAPPGLDWICVSPKAGAQLRQRTGNELKVVIPQDGIDLEELRELAFDHFFLQPLDGPDRESNTREAVDRCLRDPRWRLSLQTHKVLDIP